jgi:CheY-like chemotaxis protein
MCGWRERSVCPATAFHPHRPIRPPCLEAVHRIPPGPKVEAALVSRKRVLVVDDDTVLRDLLAEALTDDGYDVCTASNGADAFDYVQQERRQLDLVLLDLMMPIMDGRAFLHECRNLDWWSDVPVVVLSAAYRMQSSAAELGANVRATLAKPFDLTRCTRIGRMSHQTESQLTLLPYKPGIARHGIIAGRC